MSGAHQGRIQITAGIGSDPSSGVVDSRVYTSANKINPAVTLEAAVAGVLTTTASSTEGVVTATDHGLTTDDTVALFWDDGYAYDCEILSYTDDTFTIIVRGETSDDLPDNGTGDPPEITFAVAQDASENISVDGTLMEMAIGKATVISSRGLIVLYSAIGTTITELLAVEVTTTSPYIWPRVPDETRPFTDTMTMVRFYNGSGDAGRMDFFALS